MSPPARWALTPPSHPYPLAQAVIFFCLKTTLTDRFPLRSKVLCVARTFLNAIDGAAADRSSDYKCPVSGLNIV